MSNNTFALSATEESPLSRRPLLTRGLRREQAKRERKRRRIDADTLVVGIDLARENQAVTFAARNEILGRLRFRCTPSELPVVLQPAEKLRRSHGLERIVVAMDPAGHYWGLVAEAFERAGVDYVLVHPLSVKREREITRYNRSKSDPLDADLIATLALQGKFTETRLFASTDRATLNALGREYQLVRRQSAAERTRLANLWDRMLPELNTLFRQPTGQTLLAVAEALLPLSELARLTLRQWRSRVRRSAQGDRILLARACDLLPLLRTAAADPHRRYGDGLPFRIRAAAQRRRLLEQQKLHIREEILARYQRMEESVYLDSIHESDPFYNALTLAFVGDFSDYDDPRTLVKLAGSDILDNTSGDFTGRSRISKRGRSPLRAVSYQQARRLVARNTDYRQRFRALVFTTRPRRLSDMEAYVAVANSYLRTAHFLVTHRELYRPLADRKGGTA